MFDMKDKKLIIVHQVNCKGVMGAGFAKQVRDRYPELYAQYRIMCQSASSKDLLGHIMIYEEDDKIIVNMFSQEDYGNGVRQTDYEAMDKALQSLRVLYPNDIIIAPYKIGCGLGGGDWSVVSKILQKYNIETSTNIQL